MKVFNLKCGQGHPFEGWFKNHQAFEDQQESGLLSCPFCESREIQKTLSAPRLNLSHAPGPASISTAASGRPLARGEASSADPKSADSSPMVAMGSTASPALAAALQAVRELLASSEDVGDRFVDEARAMHAHDIPARPIHGQASVQEVLELSDEGISVLPLPFAGLLKTPLQ